MATGRPTIFISSTYFDLKQVRENLRVFLEDQLGYRALISEQSETFPVDPDADTVENCRRRVEQDADILVLIVGARYGSVVDGRSVTNMEYITAKEKGIPIYAFIDKRIDALIPVWKQNPTLKADGVFDNPRLLEFADSLKATDRVWAHSFELAGEIIVILRSQLAHLFDRALSDWQLLRSQPEIRALQLSAAAAQLAIDEPDSWHGLLFAQVLDDDCQKEHQRRAAYALGVTVGSGEIVDDETAMVWMRSKLAHFTRLVDATNTLLDVALAEAFRPPGVPASRVEIVNTARALAGVYADTIEAALAIRRTHVGDRFKGIREALALVPGNMIREIRAFPTQIRSSIEQAQREHKPGSGPKVVTITLTVTADAEALGRELERLRSEIDG